MARIREMFPSKFLQPEDLPVGKPTVVTIREVYPEQAKRNAAGELEAEWTIRFAEYRKPMKLKAINARAIADVLGTEETDDWVDQTIGIFPTQVPVHGKMVPVINVDIMKPQTRPALTEKNVDKRPIGADAVARFLAHCKQYGGSFDGFMAHLKRHSPEGLVMAFGVELADLPRCLAHEMKIYLDSLVPQQAPAVEGDVVDQTTGEVIETRRGQKTDPASVPGVTRGMPSARDIAGQDPPIDPDDDIPF